MARPDIVQIQLPAEYRAILKRRAAASFLAEGTYGRHLLVGALIKLEAAIEPAALSTARKPKKAKR